MDRKQEREWLLERHIERIERRAAKRLSQRQGYFLLQLVACLGGLFLCAITARFLIWISLLSILAGAGLFLYGLYMQDLYKESQQAYSILADIKRTDLARMRLDWEQIPAVEALHEADHPFDRDLDISGERSLHQLINTSFSDGGRHRLREWLLTRQPERETILQRQQRVRELTPLTIFRAKLQIAAYRTLVSPEQQRDQELLLVWLEMPLQRKPPLAIVVLSVLLSCFLDLAILQYLLWHGPILLAVLALVITALGFLATGRYRSRLFEDTSMIHYILGQLTSVIEMLEKYPYGGHKQLRQICAPFVQATQKPSSLLRHFKNIAQLAKITQGGQSTQAPGTPGAMQSGLWGFVVNLIFPLDIVLAYQFVKRKEEARVSLPQWLDAWYELEALCSLATFAYLNPDFTLPEFLDDAAPESLRATGLGHPLIPDTVRVVNDVALEHPNDLLLITGSNMAGKSTFLRTMGINLCLAFAGGPVNASHFQSRLFEIHCCIRVTDSLADGYSYFYAEVRRLKVILTRLQESGPLPIFYLVDEIFKGTNNRERFIGSASYIYAIIETGAGTGAISTHDLDLVRLTDDLLQIKNYHFQETFVKGKMTFAYKLLSGPSTTTNALKIMQMEGLPVKNMLDRLPSNPDA